MSKIAEPTDRQLNVHKRLFPSWKTDFKGRFGSLTEHWKYYQRDGLPGEVILKEKLQGFGVSVGKFFQECASIGITTAGIEKSGQKPLDRLQVANLAVEGALVYGAWLELRTKHDCEAPKSVADLMTLNGILKSLTEAKVGAINAAHSAKTRVVRTGASRAIKQAITDLGAGSPVTAQLLNERREMTNTEIGQRNVTLLGREAITTEMARLRGELRAAAGNPAAQAAIAKEMANLRAGRGRPFGVVLETEAEEPGQHELTGVTSQFAGVPARPTPVAARSHTPVLTQTQKSEAKQKQRQMLNAAATDEEYLETARKPLHEFLTAE